MTEHIKLPWGTLERHLPICPECKDTKFITADNCMKLSWPPQQTLTCSNCNISWDMITYDK